MSSSQFQSIPQDKFLLLAANLLNQAFVESTRTDAKKLYKKLVAGETINLSTVQMANNTRAAFHLSLAHSEFRGSLNFSALRASVLGLVGNIAGALREKRELKVFNAMNAGCAMIFGITAVTLKDGARNVMVLATDLGAQSDTTILQLMYLDPTQFAMPAPPVQGDVPR